jgi:hypothetical protein
MMVVVDDYVDVGFKLVNEISLSQLKVRNNHVTLLITFPSRRWLLFDFLYIQPHQRLLPYAHMVSFFYCFLFLFIDNVENHDVLENRYR